MDPRSLQFLKALLDSPGPSSFEVLPARAWRQEATSFAERVDADVSGNSFATVNAQATPRVMLAGHIDEIGVMVTYIDDEGYLSFDTIGGWDHQVFVGQRVQLLGRGGLVSGVIGKKAIHLMEKEDRDKVSKADDLWIDIGATSRKEADGRVRVGDAGVLASQVLEFPNGRIVSRSLDNRVGAFVVLEQRLLGVASQPLPWYLVSLALIIPVYLVLTAIPLFLALRAVKVGTDSPLAPASSGDGERATRL